MPWLQAKLDADRGEVAAIEEVLATHGALSITLDDRGDTPVLEPAPGATPIWAQTRLTALFDFATDLARLKTELDAALSAGVAATLRFETLADRVWEREWLRHVKPLQFGQRLWVIPGDCETPDPEALNLHLDPGLAFGSGTHATTALCLEWLAGHPLADATVVDFGCGSGILAVAAAMLGARQVWALDHDPQALSATSANASRNRVASRISVAADREPDSGEADVVIANILANVLIELARPLGDQVRPGGQLVLSGVLEEQTETVLQAYTSRFRFEPPTLRAGWARLVGTRLP